MRGKGQNYSVIKLVNKVMLHLIFVKEPCWQNESE